MGNGSIWSCSQPSSEDPPFTAYRGSISLSFHGFIFRPDTASVWGLFDSPHSLLGLYCRAWLVEEINRVRGCKARTSENRGIGEGREGIRVETGGDKRETGPVCSC